MAAPPRQARATYDAARDTDEYRRHWANSDALDPNSSNSPAVRNKLMRRSRYENGSNGYYAGIIRTHCNMVVGVGPTLRMTTKNRDFNQFVEREFYNWTQRIQLRRKLWCMCHARIQDGEAFAIMQTNPAIPMGRVQLDLTLIEGEQVHTPYLPFNDPNYTDGIKRDQYGNVRWYDVLPTHPGASQAFLNFEPIKVSPQEMLHWFKMERPGDHRSTPAMTSTLNLGASSRRFREATLRKAEIQADFSVLLESTLPPEDGDYRPDPMTAFDVDKGMMAVLPDGMKPHDLNVNTPSTEYSAFNRSHVSETARPISQPFNAAACDSSTYSFASGKLDFLCCRMEIDVEREDCNDQVLNPMFQEWFREWSLVDVRPEGPPTHQWDWPAHPIIDAQAEAQAIDIKLKNGTTSMRDVYTDQSQDFEDQLAVMCEDTFGESTPENIDKMRKIIAIRNTSKDAIPFVAEVLGLSNPFNQQQPAAKPAKPAGATQ